MDQVDDIVPTETNSISLEGGVLILPEEIMPFTAQIAGHGSLGDGQRIFLKHENGHLLKPLQAPPKGTRERGFYENLYKSEEPIDVELRKHVPDFFGIKTFDMKTDQEDSKSESTEEDYLILEDVSETLEVPNIMDVKIGSQTFDPDAPPAKRVQEDSKYKGTKKPFGFSVLGIIVHPLTGEKKPMTRYDKSFGSNLKTEDVLDMPKVFLDYENCGVVKDLVEIIIRKLEVFLDVYDKQRKYHIYGSSLLFAYDSKVVRKYLDNGKATKREMEKCVHIKLIDFAHVFPAENGEKDENFLRGLRNLIQVFQDYLALNFQ